MMHVQTLVNLVRKQVKDSYGRHIGNVIGFSLDNSGHIKSLAIEHAGGEFAEYSSTRVLVEGEHIILLPEWKEEVEQLKRDTALTQKRSAVLEQLSKEGEVSAEVYEHLKASYQAEIAALRNTYTSLTENLKAKIAALEERSAKINKFDGELKVQFRTGEIDEQTYRAATDSVNQLLKRDAEENAEISAMLAWLNGSSEEAATKQEPLAVPTITA